MIKVGDKVICIKSTGFTEKYLKKHPKWCAQVKHPKIGRRYTIRGFYHYKGSDSISVCLEEIKGNPMHKGGVECHFPIEWFEKADVISIEKKEIEKKLNYN